MTSETTTRVFWKPARAARERLKIGHVQRVLKKDDGLRHRGAVLVDASVCDPERRDERHGDRQEHGQVARESLHLHG